MKTPDCRHPDFAWCPKCEPKHWDDRTVPADKK